MSAIQEVEMEDAPLGAAAASSAASTDPSTSVVVPSAPSLSALHPGHSASSASATSASASASAAAELANGLTLAQLHALFQRQQQQIRAMQLIMNAQSGAINERGWGAVAAAAAQPTAGVLTLATRPAAAAAAASSESTESDGLDKLNESLAPIQAVFRCFPLDNREKSGPSCASGLSKKLERKHARGQLNVDLFLRAIDVAAEDDPTKQDWPLVMREYKLRARPVPSPDVLSEPMLDAVTHLCTWDGSGRSTRQLLALCQRLPHFRQRLKSITQEQCNLGPGAMRHFLLANVPSAALALTWRAIEHAIVHPGTDKDNRSSLIELVNFFRIRYAAQKELTKHERTKLQAASASAKGPKTHIAEFDGKGIFFWLLHEIDRTRLPRPDGQPPYTLDQCKAHLEQAGLKPNDGWPTIDEQKEYKAVSFAFIDAVFVQLCLDEGCPVDEIADPPQPQKQKKIRATNSNKKKKANEAGAASSASSSSVMSDDALAAAAPVKVAKPKGKRKATSDQATPLDLDPVSEFPSDSGAAAAAASALPSSPPSPVQKPGKKAKLQLSMSVPASPASSCSSSAVTEPLVTTPPPLPNLPTLDSPRPQSPLLNPTTPPPKLDSELTVANAELAPSPLAAQAAHGALKDPSCDRMLDAYNSPRRSSFSPSHDSRSPSPPFSFPLPSHGFHQYQ